MGEGLQRGGEGGHVVGEALWRVSGAAWVFVEERTERAGRVLLTPEVEDLDDILACPVAHGVDHDPVETYDNGV